MTLSVAVTKAQELPALAFRTTGPLPGSWNSAGWECVAAHGPEA